MLLNLARALVANPEILVIHKPTLGFDDDLADNTIQVLREYVDKWVNLFGTTAGEAARIIRDDQIDILVELTGHTANNRLDILACRPAPIQVSPVGKPAVPCKLGQSPTPAEPGQQAHCAL